jgi:cyclopropane-fatty-acyl-phospholipid synthase
MAPTVPLVTPLVNRATSLAWPHLVSLSRRAVISVLSRIATGQLVITDGTSNITTVCGALEPKQPNSVGLKHKKEKASPPRAELKVLSESFWVRMLLFADMVSSR